MRKLVITAAALILGATTASSALADDAAPQSGLEVGARIGYGIPMGSATGGTPSTSLSDVFSNKIPIQIDALYMINPNIRVGAYFEYAFVGLASNISNACSSCSASGLRYGLQAHYHIMPDQTIDPWVGVGVGLESLSISANGQSATTSGIEFLNLQVGADYKVMPALGVGPFAQFSLGQYSSTATPGGASGDIQNKAMHEWLTIGVRGAYDIGF